MNLREIRKEREITQFELAKVIDVHPQRISEIERGIKDLRFQEAVKAARFLGVSLDELAGITNEEKRQVADEPSTNISRVENA